MRAHAQVEARKAAQAQVDEQVRKTLEAEKAAYMEKLTDSIAMERMKTKDERLMVQLYVSMRTCYDFFCLSQNLSNVNMKLFPLIVSSFPFLVLFMFQWMELKVRRHACLTFSFCSALHPKPLSRGGFSAQTKSH